jgi:predicted nucleic acid-binding protein
MTGERALSFVDTNVLVYAFDKSSSPKKRVAQRLMNELMEEDRLRVSTQVLQELFVTLTKKVSQPCSGEKALAVLEGSCTGWCGGVVHRRFERWAGNSRRSNQQSVRSVIDSCPRFFSDAAVSIS